MVGSLCMGIIGDYDPRSPSHAATENALDHAARTLGVDVLARWLPTPSLEGASGETTLEQFDGLWCASGSPYASMEGALRAIRFAREQDRPFIGT